MILVLPLPPLTEVPWGLRHPHPITQSYISLNIFAHHTLKTANTLVGCCRSGVANMGLDYSAFCVELPGVVDYILLCNCCGRPRESRADTRAFVRMLKK